MSINEAVQAAIEKLALEGEAVQSRMPFPTAVAMEAIDDAIPWHPANFYVSMMEPRLRMRWEHDKKRAGMTGAIKFTKVYDSAPWVSENYYRLTPPEVIPSHVV